MVKCKCIRTEEDTRTNEQAQHLWTDKFSLSIFKRSTWFVTAVCACILSFSHFSSLKKKKKKNIVPFTELLSFIGSTINVIKAFH